MMPDRGYRRATRRLYGACVLVAAGLVVLAGLVFQAFPVAGVILGLMAIGALRLAREVRDEIEGWQHPEVAVWRDEVQTWPAVRPWQLEAWKHYESTRDDLPSTLEVDVDGYLWLGGVIVGRVDR